MWDSIVGPFDDQRFMVLFQSAVQIVVYAGI